MFTLSDKTAELLGTVTLVPLKMLRINVTLLPVILAFLNSQNAAENPFALTVIASPTVTPLIRAFPPLIDRLQGQRNNHAG